jgi:hypothetical protein
VSESRDTAPNHPLAKCACTCWSCGDRHGRASPARDGSAPHGRGRGWRGLGKVDTLERAAIGSTGSGRTGTFSPRSRRFAPLVAPHPGLGHDCFRSNSLLPYALSRDLRLDGYDLRLDSPEPADEPASQQLLLPGFAPPVARPQHRRARPTRPARPTPTVDDPLLVTFLRRLADQGRARKGQQAYQYQMRSMLTIAERLTGRTVSCVKRQLELPPSCLRGEDTRGRKLPHQ